jgi:hypothetical protein
MKYRALSIVAGWYTALAVLSVIGCVIGGIAGFAVLANLNEPGMGVLALIAAAFFGALACISFLAMAQSIRLFIDLEANTSRQVNAVEQLENAVRTIGKSLDGRGQQQAALLGEILGASLDQKEARKQTA